MSHAVGILGVGSFLPPEVRRNDWWSHEVVERWKSRAGRAPMMVPRTPSEELIAEEIKKQSQDPFQGAVERRVMPEGMTVHDMEERAARLAIARAHIDPQQIDLILTHTVTPDEQLGNPACQLHFRLGLPARCLTLQADAGTYSFIAQLAIARSMIAAGGVRHALLAQSCGISRLVDWETPMSVLFGDGASAVIVGPVADGRGIVTDVHTTEGRYPRTLVASVPGQRWFDSGRAVVHVADPMQMHEVFLRTVDACCESIDALLTSAGLGPKDVRFLCVHQGTPWLRRVVQDRAGLSNARSVETFAETGYLFSAVLPTGLFYGEETRNLRPDDLVVIVGGGPGMTYGGVLIRWGC